MTTIGIDPGAEGAIVVVSGGKAIEVWTADTRAKVPGYFVAGDPDAVALVAFLRGYLYADATIILETPFAPGKIGTSNAIVIGRRWGILYAACRLSGLPVVTVTPAKWSSDLFGGRKGVTGREKKEAAVRLCGERLPSLALVPAGSRVAHTGLADAGCIALWGQRG